MSGAGQRRFGIAALDEARWSADCPAGSSWMQRRASGLRLARLEQRAAARSMSTGKSAEVETRRWPARSPAMSATASPRKRATPSASAGWSAKGGMTPKQFLPGMSAAVKTADDAGMSFDEGVEVAEGEARRDDAASGRPAPTAHRPESCRRRIFPRPSPWHAVEPDRRGADGLAGCGQAAGRGAPSSAPTHPSPPR